MSLFEQYFNRSDEKQDRNHKPDSKSKKQSKVDAQAKRMGVDKEWKQVSGIMRAATARLATDRQKDELTIELFGDDPTIDISSLEAATATAAVYDIVRTSGTDPNGLDMSKMRAAMVIFYAYLQEYLSRKAGGDSQAQALAMIKECMDRLDGLMDQLKELDEDEG